MGEKNELKRAIDWKGGFWMACGIPAAVFTNIGGVAAIAGKMSWVVFIISVSFGFLQAFSYAEIAGLYPNKSGGASVYGAMAWIRYSKIIAPLSTWCNWFAWSPGLTIVSGLGATYIVQLFPADSLIRTWNFTLLDLNWLMQGLSLRISFTWIIAVICLGSVFTIQHFGISRAAKVQKTVSLVSLLIIFGIALIPIFNGSIPLKNIWPLEISGTAGVQSHWGMIMAALFVAGYSTYSFETAVCYVSEFKNPSKDTFRAILSSGILCLFAFSIVPFSFQGYLGEAGLTAGNIMDGTGIAAVMASMVGGSHIIFLITYILFLFVFVIGMMTAMAGSSRTIYQASVDGWLPKFLSKINKHQVPVAAMWTDLAFNIVLLTFSNYFFILVAANVCYMIFVFLNLNAAWIHRLDHPQRERPYKAPTWIIVINSILGFANLFLIGAYAGCVEAGPVLSGFLWAMIIIPVFLYRHYVTDKGRFTDDIYEDLGCKQGEKAKRNAGILPYLTIIAAIAVLLCSFFLFR